MEKRPTLYLVTFFYCEGGPSQVPITVLEKPPKLLTSNAGVIELDLSKPLEEVIKELEKRCSLAVLEAVKEIWREVVV